MGPHIMCFQTVIMCGTVFHSIALMLSHGPQSVSHFTECEWSALLMPHLSVNTLWWQELSLWLSQHGFEGVLAEGTFSLANAEQHLRDKWYHGICQPSATKVSTSS